MGRNSRKDPGQPCRRMIGMASERLENRETKCISKVSFPSSSGRVKCGKVFI